MFFICKMVKKISWYWFISLVDVQVYWLGLFKSFWSTVSFTYKKKNNFLERKFSNPSVWSCQKNNLLFVVHVSYFSIISSKRWSKNAFVVFVFFLQKITFFFFFYFQAWKKLCNRRTKEGWCYLTNIKSKFWKAFDRGWT